MSTLKTKAQSILDEKDSKIIPENIKKDVTIFDVTGTMEEGIDTSDATATEDDILFGRTAYIDGEKVTGKIPTYDYNTDTSAVKINHIEDDTVNHKLDMIVNIDSCSYDNGVFVGPEEDMPTSIAYSQLVPEIGLTADKIVAGETILGIEGTVEEGTDTSDATATASDILIGETAYVDGEKITGTLEISDNSIITLSNGGRLEINCDNLANILSEQLTVEQKALQIYNGGSWQLPAIVLSYAYDVDSQSADIVGLTLGDGSYSLKLIVGSNIVAVIDEDNSATEQYYKSVMTAQDLIDLLNAIGKKVVNLSISSTMYMYSPTSIIINGETNYEFGGTIIHKTDIINNFIHNSSAPITEVITDSDSLKFDFTTLAELIDDNTDVSEKQKYLNGASSGDSPMVILCTGTYIGGSSDPTLNTRLCIHRTNYIYITCIDDEEVHMVSSKPVISAGSCIEIPDIMTVQDLIDLFNTVKSGEIVCDGLMSGPDTFEFEMPLTEITLKGPNLNKTISVPSGTTFMEVING